MVDWGVPGATEICGQHLAKHLLHTFLAQDAEHALGVIA